MGKIKYLFKRIIKMDYKNMFRIAKAISKKTKKNYISIVIDMIKCGFKYQAGYYDYQEFEFYNLNNEERKTYLTRGKNNEIIKKFNNKSSFHKFENKVEFNKIFNKYLKRNWMMQEITTVRWAGHMPEARESRCSATVGQRRFSPAAEALPFTGNPYLRRSVFLMRSILPILRMWTLAIAQRGTATITCSCRGQRYIMREAVRAVPGIMSSRYAMPPETACI